MDVYEHCDSPHIRMVIIGELLEDDELVLYCMYGSPASMDLTPVSKTIHMMGSSAFHILYRKTEQKLEPLTVLSFNRLFLHLNVMDMMFKTHTVGAIHKCVEYHMDTCLGNMNACPVRNRTQLIKYLKACIGICPAFTLLKTKSHVHALCEQEALFRLHTRKASIIQAVWRSVVSNPYHPVGKRRLMHEWDLLTTCESTPLLKGTYDSSIQAV